MKDTPIGHILLNDNGRIQIVERFLEGPLSGNLFQDVLNEMRWHTGHVRLFGKTIETPRRLAFQGDEGVFYRYSGIRHEAADWTPLIQMIKTHTEKQLNLRFNAVLGNHYRDGNDSLDWHADNEQALGSEPAIAIVSLGATRKLEFRSIKKDKRLSVEMTDGSLVLMDGPIQTHWKHRVARTSKQSAPRISLSFRWLQRRP